MKKTGIIGGAGFIGSHITKKFLAEGYDVRVSVRDLSQKEKYAHLHDLENAASHLEIVQMDVQDEAALRAFLQDCDIVVHSGTPFQLDVQDPQRDLLDPTIKGTENFLKVAGETPSLKKVVFVGSVASINTSYPLPDPSRSADGVYADDVYTEADEPYLDANDHPYAQAKYYADQVVRKFVKSQPDAAFEVVSVYPTFVTGHSLSARDDSSSMGIQYLFKNKIAPNPFVEMMFAKNVEFAMVSVADVAEGIFRAATTPGLHGKNYLLTGESYKVSDITRMLNGQEPAEAARTVYSGAAATQDLGLQFQAAHVPLNEWA
ncbi:NAD-dependent epimerase/dehydratase family protein [Salmonirosea aquatica]|uniref:NAD-dependent epimerase/dehydratase family protein n=1 Tax=Salmonirosea aquatica TaxID=2654236 RepID=A0A7C9FE91_9BACT|nr:NAD-dependent epimerase/dehydratase family protein [Cytophagaceae bacterium SJW1-29]